MDLYQEQIIDLAKHPLNRGALKNATHTHSGVNVTCGDHVRIYLKVKGKGASAVIEEAMWEGEGCAISVAAASLLTEELKGKPLKVVKTMELKDMLTLLGIEMLGPARVKCATLCLETVKGV